MSREKLFNFISGFLQSKEKRPLWLELLLCIDGLIAFSLWLLQKILEQFLRIAPRNVVSGNKKRIIFLTNERFTLPAARIRCADMAEFLKENGFETVVFSFGEKYFSGQKGFYTRLSDTQKMYANLRALWDMRHEKETLIFVQRAHYHALAALSLKHAFGVKLVLDLDDFDWENNPNGFKWLSRFPPFNYSKLAPKLMKFADGCSVSSHRLFEIVQTFQPKTVLIPTGVRMDRFPAHPHREADEVCFSWVGTVMHMENLHTMNILIDQFLSISSIVPKRLSIVGGGTWFPELKKRTAGCPEITIQDWVPPDKISDLMASIDVGLFPLFEDTEFARCKSPTKLFEYMASHRAVISSNQGEAKKMIQHGENGMSANTPEDFGVLMKTLLENKALRQRLADRGLATVQQKYQLPCLAASLAHFLNEIYDCQSK